MDIQQLRKIAKMFGVRVDSNPQRFEPHIEKGFVTLTADGETVECVYFNPETNQIRLRKPNRGFTHGDFSNAICLALTRRDSENENLCSTIRALSALTTAPK